MFEYFINKYNLLCLLSFENNLLYPCFYHRHKSRFDKTLRDLKEWEEPYAIGSYDRIRIKSKKIS